MKKLMMMIALAACAAAITGCSVTKVEYERNDKGETSYRLYRNDHWLKTESTGLAGGMTSDGKFEFEAAGMKSSPSEEFNRTMQTYTSAFIQLAQIAAAAYNPSSSSAVSSAVKSANTSTTPTVVGNTQQKETKETGATNAAAPAAAATNATEDCPDCVVKQ
jgi:hypothetical protein